MLRLPQLPPATSFGVVYVVQRGSMYKIGFTRNSLQRRVRDSGGTLLFTIPAGNQPSVLERLIQVRFIGKRVVATPRCEWFYLDDNDVHWLRELAVATVGCR